MQQNTSPITRQCKYDSLTTVYPGGPKFFNLLEETMNFKNVFAKLDLDN